MTGALNAVIAYAGEPVRGGRWGRDRARSRPVASVFENNVVGTMLTLKYGARELVRAGGGSFVAISSIARSGGPLAAPISSAKAALEQLCQMPRRSWPERGDVERHPARPGRRAAAEPAADEADDFVARAIPLGGSARPTISAGWSRFLVGHGPPGPGRRSLDGGRR